MSLSEIKSDRAFIDPIFNFSASAQLVLCVQLGIDGMYMAIFDAAQNRCVAVKEFFFDAFQNHFQVKESFLRICQDEKLLQLNFTKVVVAIIDKHALLIPNALYDEQLNTSYLEFAGQLKGDEQIDKDDVINLEARNVYSVSHSLKESIHNRFPDAIIQHSATSLIDGLVLQYKNTEGNFIALNVQYSHFEILYFDGGKLKLFNSFNFTTAEDFIYYVLFVVEQLSLNTDKIQVEVYGELDEQSSTHRFLQQYIRNVSFGKRSELLKYSEILDAVPSHYYFNLYQQFLCVS